MAAPSGPTLDRSTEPWVGVFPGLGTVRVHVDGSVKVDVEDDPTEAHVLREAALRHGWAEPLALVRRGYRCLWGSGLVPANGAGCLAVTGTLNDVAIVLLELVSDGWSVLADQPIPTQWVDGRLVAFPKASPVLVSSRLADRFDLTAVDVRVQSDAVSIDVLRAPSPLPVLAVVGVGGRRPDEAALEQLVGHEHFRAASEVMVGGVMGLDPTDDATVRDILREHLDLARLPFARLRFGDDTLAADVAELCQWWSDLVGNEVAP